MSLPDAPSSIADQIALHVGALTPLDAAALIETVRCMLTVAAAEAVAAYKLSSAAVALAAESLPVKKPVRSEGLALLTKAPDALLDASDVASMLCVDISWVHNHCTRVEPFIPHIKLGGGRYATRRFKKELILEFIDNHLITNLKRA